MRRFLAASMLLAGLIAIGLHQRANDARRIVATRAVLEDQVLRTVILGDSLARGAGDERGLGIAGWLDQRFQTFQATPVVNLGINGARTFNVRALLRRDPVRVALRTADVIVISIGGNDLYGDARARLLSTFMPRHQQERALRRIERLIAGVRSVNPAAHIYLLGLYNPYRRSSLRAWLDEQVNLWDARLITRFAAARDVTVIRICDLLDRDDRISRLDRFHPGSAGYAAIAARLASSLLHVSAEWPGACRSGRCA